VKAKFGIMSCSLLSRELFVVIIVKVIIVTL